MAQTVRKNIRVTPEQWERIETLAREGNVSADQLVVEHAMEALERRKWPQTEAENSSVGRRPEIVRAWRNPRMEFLRPKGSFRGVPSCKSPLFQ